MKHSKQVYFAVQFARFCDDTGIAASYAAELVTLAKLAFHAGVRECNKTDYSADRQRRAFEKLANDLGFKAQWPGLMPMLRKGKRDYYLPS